jgi:GT2 family glycosyltransferase
MTTVGITRTPDLSIIIVNYNGGLELLYCLKALDRVRNELTFDVIVVDNCSTDGSLEAAESKNLNFIAIHACENLGFAAACNRGLAMALGRHAMLLNPDTEVQPNALSKLVAALDSHPKWGIVGPRMLDQFRHAYRATRRFPRPFDLFCETTRLAFLFPRSKLFAAYFYGERDPLALDEVDQIEGSALMISGSARKLVGNLDPQFFIFFEEVDWCKRVRAEGLEIHVVQEAEVLHLRSTSMSRNYLTTRPIHALSSMKYFRKHHGEQGLRNLRRWMIAGLWIREAAMWLASLLGKGKLARLRARGARLERRVYSRGLPE